MKSDPPIDVIREIRRRISASVNHDPRQLVEHYRQLQQRHQDRIVSRGAPESTPLIEPAAEQRDAVDR